MHSVENKLLDSFSLEIFILHICTAFARSGLPFGGGGAGGPIGDRISAEDLHLYIINE